jgi:uncharacterized protein (DUF2384 family)
MSTAINQLYDDQGRVDMAAVSNMIGEPMARLARMTPITANALLKNPTSERAQPAARRFVRVLAEMSRLLESRKLALIWLRTPHPELEDHSPLNLFHGKRFDAVEGLVQDLLSGMPG